MKRLSRAEMKNVSGGKAYSIVCTCGENTIVCGYDTPAGFANCNNMAINYCQTHNGGATMSCNGGPNPS